MELASKYNPADVEGKWYKYWEDGKFFHSEPDIGRMASFFTLSPMAVSLTL